MAGTVTASLWTPMSVARKHLEDDLQKQVVAYLQWALPNDAVFTAFPAGGQRSSKAAARLNGLGLRRGWPDLQIVWRGHYIGIELKAASGSLSEAQRLMHRQLKYAGAEVVTCRTLPCVETSLRELGVPLRGSVMG